MTTIVNIPGAAFRFGISAVSGFCDSASTVYGASRNLGTSLVNVTSSWLTWSRVNSTEALPPSPPSVLREEVVCSFLSKAADSTLNFFDMFHEHCSARGLESFLQETILIFDKARQVGREAQIPNCGEEVDSILTVHNSFTNVYLVLSRVRWAGLGFLEGYIGWLLYLQDRIEQLPAEDDEAYLPQWLAFIADIEDELNATANDAISFLHHVEDGIPLVSDAHSLAMTVTQDLDVHSTSTLEARSRFMYLPNFVYTLCRDNFLVLQIHEENLILLRYLAN
ncbi:hypothetical protein BDZ89DRAFT_1146437 [Hymenopellis radicata]|nr:hypothetical protein BDZ89DRAFT_1146437 [Hymenopellis radicata]